jgi:hypothetical protein
MQSSHVSYLLSSGFSHHRDRYIMMDPEFPSRIFAGEPIYPIRAFEHCVIFVIEEYTKRGLSYETDRPKAIEGLEQRIAAAFRCESRFGIIESHLHYNLLWEPSGDKVARIKYNEMTPSWSWMSYPGPVRIQRGLQALASGEALQVVAPWQSTKQQLNDVWHETAGLVVNSNISFRQGFKNELVADLAALRHCTLSRREDNYVPFPAIGMDYVLHGANGMVVGTTAFDDRSITSLENIYCVVLASFDTPAITIEGICFACMLVAWTGRSDEFRRVGIGLIQSRCVLRLGNFVRIV